VTVHTNACEASVPQGIIYHYDVVILPEEKTLPPRFTMQLIKQMQMEPEFHPVGVYDGKKNLFMPHEINFGGANSRQYEVVMNGNHQPAGRPPKVYQIRLTKVAEINPEVLQRFIDGKQSQDEAVLTVLTALNIVIRMTPIQNNPFNARSFFTDTERKDVGYGFELWRGLFQSLRPSAGRLLINVDITTGMFHKSGPLIPIALEVIGRPGDNPNVLSSRSGLPDRVLKALEKYLRNVRVSVKPATPNAPPRIQTISSLTREGARDIRFQTREGNSTDVASYFRQVSTRPLRFPDMICAKVCYVYLFWKVYKLKLLL
jgi:eukaryotic translation initiation factor 2C